MLTMWGWFEEVDTGNAGEGDIYSRPLIPSRRPTSIHRPEGASVPEAGGAVKLIAGTAEKTVTSSLLEKELLL